MAGHHPHDRGEEPGFDDVIDPSGEGREDQGNDGDGIEIVPLPAVLRESGWSRMDDSMALDQWQAVPGPPLDAYADAPSGWRRWLGSRAALVAVAALLGGGVGALLVGTRGAEDGGEAVEALRGSIGQLATELRALKENVGAGSEATTQGLAAIEQRIAGAETAQATLTARITDLSTRAAPAPQVVSPEITGSVRAAPLPVAPDWILWRVRNGRALVQGGGGYFEVVQGSALPGLGIVQRIVKEDGRWVIYTPGAVILGRG